VTLEEIADAPHERRRYNRHTIAPVLNNSPPAIELEGFEQIEATPGTALLRISARATGGGTAGRTTRGGASRGSAKLIVDDGARLHHFTPLPAPPDPPGVLRYAYSVPAAVLGGRAAYALELSDGSTVDLPSPTAKRRIARAAVPERPAFYALAGGRVGEMLTLLHPPYTAWHLSYVVIGASAAPAFDGGRLGATVLAFFLGVGLGAIGAGGSRGERDAAPR